MTRKSKQTPSSSPKKADATALSSKDLDKVVGGEETVTFKFGGYHPTYTQQKAP